MPGLVPINSLQQATAAGTGEDMNTSNITRFTGLLIAVLMTIAIEGAMLLTFDALAQQGYASSGQTPTVVTLGTVSVVAARS